MCISSFSLLVLSFFFNSFPIFPGFPDCIPYFSTTFYLPYFPHFPFLSCRLFSHFLSFCTYCLQYSLLFRLFPSFVNFAYFPHLAFFLNLANFYIILYYKFSFSQLQRILRDHRKKRQNIVFKQCYLFKPVL